jgi:hypothetical protein
VCKVSQPFSQKSFTSFHYFLFINFNFNFLYLPEDWGEDFVLTSHMGVAFSSGLSKNSTWSDPDAVIPVMKVNHIVAKTDWNLLILSLNI